MQMTIQDDLADTVFAKAGPEHIQTAPFPHLVIEDALPPDTFQRLLASRPSPQTGDRPSLRVPTPAWMLIQFPFYDPVWKAFAEAHTRPAIVRRVQTLFAAHLPPETPRVEGKTFGVLGRETHDTAEVLTDARLEVITPTGTAWGSHRRGHLDTRNRLFTALYYLRPPGDDSDGGGLDLFRWRGTPTEEQKDAFELCEDTVIERAATVPYRGNTLVCFPQSVAALHGQAPRGPTTHDRAYVFITAEVARDWF